MGARRDVLGWVGTVIDGKFAVDAVCGEGGFGVVYRGTHLALQAPVAIKCLKLPAQLDDADRRRFLAAFEREARLLHRLSTRTTGIVQALDLGVATSPAGIWTPYTVMEWLEGETLEVEIARHPRGRSLNDVIALLSPVAAALAIAHEEGVSHLDIKPSNIFLAKTRRGMTTKILDFGLARVFTDPNSFDLSRVAAEGSFHGFTPRYAAPEQFGAQFGPPGPWTDAFALALLLIELATGTPALAGQNLLQLCFASCDEKNRPSLRARRPDTPLAIEKVIQKAVAVRPEHRYETAGQLWSALQSARGVRAAQAPEAPHHRVESPAPISRKTLTGVPASGSGPSPGSVDIRSFVGENRICTVISVDVSAFAALSIRLDPGEVKELFDHCLHLAAEKIEGMQGYVDGLGREGVVGIFGAVMASDSNAERAAHAALRILAALGKVSLPRGARGGRPLPRIGISTGRVFMELGGAEVGRGFIGEAVSIATRLAQVAPGGGILIDRNTYRQIRGSFNVEATTPVDVAGQQEQVYLLKGAVVLRQTFCSPLFAGLDTKLMGRATERQRLADLIEAVIEERRAALATLVGAPGMGRSRMLAEVLSGLTLSKQIVILVVAQGSALTADAMYGFVASALRARFGIPEGASPEFALRRLRSGVRWLRAHLARERSRAGLSEEPSDGERDGAFAEDLSDALSQIAGMLGVKPQAFATSREGSMDEQGIHAKHRIAAAIAMLVRFAATQAPVIMLFDDLQWADDASLDLIDELVVRVDDLPVLVVCSTRPDLSERRPQWGGSKAAHHRVHLTPLRRRHIEEIVRDRLRRVSDLPAQFVQTLADRAEGSPLILDEIMHLLLDAGVIEARGEAWAVREDRLDALSLPATIQEIVQARLDRLDGSTRVVLGRAAVVGRTFWEGAVERLGKTGEPVAAGSGVAETLVGLRERQLVRARDVTSFPGEREWVFAESATQEVAYEMLPARARRSLHLLVADWLKQRAGGARVASVVALHADRGGDAATAAAEYLRAAEQASALGQNAEALRLLLRAREIHDETEVADGASREAGDAFEEMRVASWRDRVRLRVTLGDVLRRLGRLDEAEAAYEQARARILRHERRRGVATDGEAAWRWEARIDFRLALAHKERGSNATAQDLVERAIALAREGKSPEETLEMYGLLALLHRRARRLEASRQVALEGLRVCQTITPGDPRRREGAARLLLAVASTLYTLGRLVAAERSYRQVVRLATVADNLDVLGRALNGIGGARLAQGDVAGARVTLLQALKVKERAGDLHQLAVAYSNLAETENRLKEHAAALEHASRGVRLAEQIGARADLAEMYRNVADASLGLENVDAALDAAARAFAIAEEAGRIYLDDAALSLARACARAAETSAMGSSLHTRAIDAARTLDVVLSRSAHDPALRRRAEECRALLGTLLA